VHAAATALVNAAVGRPELGAERFEAGFGGAEEPRSRLGTTFEGRHRAEPHDGLGDAALVA